MVQAILVRRNDLNTELDALTHAVGVAGETMKKQAEAAKVAAQDVEGAVTPAIVEEEASDGVKLGLTVKRMREETGWSIQRLAREAGVSSATIFKIEKDRMVPSVTVLLKLARALKQPIAALLENQSPKERTGYAVSRAGDRQEFRFAELPLVIERTVGGWADRQLEAGFYIVDQGGSPTRAPLSHPGEKLYFMLEGRVRFEVDGEHVLLEQGDVLHLKATLPHRWENAADGPSRMFFVVTPVPSFAKQKIRPLHNPLYGEETQPFPISFPHRWRRPVMHLKLDEERALLQETVRAFAKEQVRPRARAWEEEQQIDDVTLDACWQLGFASMGAGPGYGGAADDDTALPSALTGAIVLEELAWADLGFALAATSPMHAVVPLLTCGHEGLKREILPALLSSTRLPKATGAWVEGSRGYDLRSMSTRVQSTAQGPLLSGRKTLVPRGDHSEITVVIAKKSASDDAGAFEPYVLLGEHVSGLSRGKKCDVIGPRATALVELELDECTARPLFAKAGVSHALLEQRALVGSAAASLGVARAACEYAAEYARDRRAFGRAIAQNQSIAFMIAEAAMDVEAARWLTWKAAWAIDRAAESGDSALVEASRAHRFASDLAWRTADNCVQILGGHGVIRDHLAELFFRNSRTLARTPGWFMV